MYTSKLPIPEIKIIGDSDHELPHAATSATSAPHSRELKSKDEINDVRAMWPRDRPPEEFQSEFVGLEHFFSKQTNRIFVRKSYFCGMVIRDTDMKKIYRIKMSWVSRSSVAIVKDRKGKEVLRFQKNKQNPDIISVFYNKTRLLGKVIPCRFVEALADSYMMYILTNAEDQEMLRVFSRFDEEGSCPVKGKPIASYVLRHKPPYEIATFEHTTRRGVGQCCGARSGWIRDKRFQCEFHEELDPLARCMILAAAFWRMTEGFLRYREVK